MGGVLLTAPNRDLRIEREGGAVVIRFVRPEDRNPLSIAVLERLYEVIENLGPDVERVIFTGERDVFASGANLREIGALSAEDAADFARRGQALMSRISELKPLTIAAINGYCFGGALDLALACDVRVASSNATFAHPGAGLGIITGWGGTQRLPRLIGAAAALEMFFTASPINVERALQVGLVDAIEDDVVQAALTFVPTLQEV